MKRALVTLVIGDKYIQLFKKYCAANWKEYADKYNYDVVVIDNYIDVSRKAKNRSPSWQKCLILQHEKVKEYEKTIDYQMPTPEALFKITEDDIEMSEYSPTQLTIVSAIKFVPSFQAILELCP